MTSTRRALLSLPLLFVLLPASTADAALAKSGSPSVTVHAKTNAGVGIDAKTSDMSLADDGKTVTFEVPVSSLKTGIDLRDGHLRKYLEAEKYPKVTITIARGELTFPADGKTAEAAVGSNVTMHGVKKYEQIHYTISRSGDTYSIYVKALWLKLQDYKIERPSFSGVKVDESVSVEVAFKAKDGP